MTSKNILIGILFVAVFAAGFMIGRTTAPSGAILTQEELQEEATTNTQTGTPDTADTTDTTNTTGTTNTGQTTQTEGSVDTQITEPIEVGSKMTAEQRKMLESFGLNPDEITITPGMIACAEAKVGTARIQEITNGATPSFMEGAALVTCYGQ